MDALGSFAFNYFHHLDSAFSFLITLVTFNTSFFLGGGLRHQYIKCVNRYVESSWDSHMDNFIFQFQI